MRTKQEVYRELSAAIAETEEFATWKPEKIGDLIAGEVVEFDTALQTKNGIKTIVRIRSNWCITGGVELANDIYTVWVSQTQLKKKIDALPHIPFKGDEMQIKYCGDLPVKGANPMKLFYFRYNPKGPAKDDAKVEVDPFLTELKNDVAAVKEEERFLSDKDTPLMEEMGGVK
jgi:hypothetical protein